jgi:hypothetical protein
VILQCRPESDCRAFGRHFDAGYPAVLLRRYVKWTKKICQRKFLDTEDQTKILKMGGYFVFGAAC